MDSWKEVYKKIDELHKMSIRVNRSLFLYLPAALVIIGGVMIFSLPESPIAAIVFFASALMVALRYGFSYIRSKGNPIRVLSGTVLDKSGGYKVGMISGTNRGLAFVYMNVGKAARLGPDGLEEIEGWTGKRRVGVHISLWRDIPAGKTIDLILFPIGKAVAYVLDGQLHQVNAVGII